MLLILPDAAQRVTVLGSTRKRAATSPGVSRRSLLPSIAMPSRWPIQLVLSVATNIGFIPSFRKIWSGKSHFEHESGPSRAVETDAAGTVPGTGSGATAAGRRIVYAHAAPDTRGRPSARRSHGVYGVCVACLLGVVRNAVPIPPGTGIGNSAAENGHHGRPGAGAETGPRHRGRTGGDGRRVGRCRNWFRLMRSGPPRR